MKLENNWPHIGGEVNVTFADAACLAEGVARRRERLVTMVKGNISFGLIEWLANLVAVTTA